MGEFLVKLVEIIMHIGESHPGPQRTSILGADYEAKEGRRSAFWVAAILIIFFLGGWLVWRWLQNQ